MVSVVVPDEEYLLNWARAHGIEGDMEAVCANKVHTYICTVCIYAIHNIHAQHQLRMIWFLLYWFVKFMRACLHMSTAWKSVVLGALVHTYIRMYIQCHRCADTVHASKCAFS